MQDSYLNPVSSFVKNSTRDAASGLIEREAFDVRSSSFNSKPRNDFNYMLKCFNIKAPKSHFTNIVPNAGIALVRTDKLRPQGENAT